MYRRIGAATSCGITWLKKKLISDGTGGDSGLRLRKPHLEESARLRNTWERRERSTTTEKRSMKEAQKGRGTSTGWTADHAGRARRRVGGEEAGEKGLNASVQSSIELKGC